MRVNCKIGPYFTYYISIWSITFSVLYQFSLYRCLLYRKSRYIKQNNKKIFFMPHQLLIILPHQFFLKKKKQIKTETHEIQPTKLIYISSPPSSRSEVADGGEEQRILFSSSTKSLSHPYLLHIWLPKNSMKFITIYFVLLKE